MSLGCVNGEDCRLLKHQDILWLYFINTTNHTYGTVGKRLTLTMVHISSVPEINYLSLDLLSLQLFLSLL